MVLHRQIVITGSRGIAAEVIQACSNRGYSIFILGGEEEDSHNLAESITEYLLRKNHSHQLGLRKSLHLQERNTQL